MLCYFIRNVTASSRVIFTALGGTPVLWVQGNEQLGILEECSRQNLQIMHIFLLASQHAVRKKLFTGLSRLQESKL